MTMEQVGPPAALAVSLIEAKKSLRIDDDDDTAFDMLIEIWIRGVTAEAEHARQCLVNRPMRVTLDSFPAAIRLAAPTFSVESVSYVDTGGAPQVLDPSDYYVDKVSKPGYIVPAPGKAWPATACAVNSVVVNFTAGYGPDETTVPDCARLYILARLAEQWEPSTKKFESTSQSVYLTRLLYPVEVYG